MHNLLSIDEVTGLLDLVEHRAYIEVPLVEGLVSALLTCPGCALLEDDDTLHPINFCCDASFLHDHVAQLALGELNRHTCELRESG